MADSTTEIDLDSVIDRLLEGESPLPPPPTSLFPVSPGRIHKVDGVDCALALPSFCRPLCPRGRPMPTGRQPACIHKESARQSVEGSIYEARLRADPLVLATTIIDFPCPPPRHNPVTHPILIVFSPFHSAR